MSRRLRPPRVPHVFVAAIHVEIDDWNNERVLRNTGRILSVCADQVNRIGTPAVVNDLYKAAIRTLERANDLRDGAK